MNKVGLTPTPIMDKNGKATTVYRKHSSSSAAPRSLPSPSVVLPPEASLMSSDERTDMMDMIERKISNRMGDYRVGGRKASRIIRNKMDAYSDGLIVTMRDIIMPEAKDSDEAKDYADLMELLLNRDLDLTGTMVHEYLTFRKAFKPNQTREMILKYVDSVHSYKQLPAMESYAEADDGTKSQIRALLSVTNEIHNIYLQRMIDYMGAAMYGKNEGKMPKSPSGFNLPLDSDGLIITDEHLITLVLDYPERSSEINELLVNNTITDGALLREIMESDTQAIREGYL